MSVKGIGACFLVAFFMLPCAAVSDVIRLHNGDVMTGRLISFEGGTAVFNTRYDAVVSIPAGQLMSIETDDEYRVTFKSGDRLTGRLQWSAEDKSTSLYSSQLGRMVLNIDNIASMTRYFEQQAPVAPAPGQEGISEQQAYGEDVSRAAPLDFLTGSTVLLSPGRYELDFGLRYNQSRQASSLMNIGYFQRSSMVAKRLSLNTTLRAGLADSLEGWVSVPLHHTYVEQVSTNEFVRETRDTRVGDVSLGVQYQVLQESSRYPALSASLSVSAPTGKKRYFEIVDSWQDPLNNGSGHWVVAPGISFVRTTDPAIMFGGLNYVHAFPATISGYRVRPGWGVDAYLGLGFALNDRLSVGSRFSYSHRSNQKVDGDTIQGSSTDPMDLTLSFSYALSREWVVVPQVAYALNDDAGTPGIALSLKRKL